MQRPGYERLQKILARAGFGSRRAAEELIAAGRVAVDGQVAKLGDKADPSTQRIEVDGRPIQLPQAYTYLALNKPPGYLCSRRDRHHAKLVYELLPANLRDLVVTVGRLDLRSEGLLLLTDDGELAHRLMHPRYGVLKVYHVVAQGPSRAEEKLEEGVMLEDGPARPDSVVVKDRRGDAVSMYITLSEGRKREVRRMCAAVGLKVLRLRRVAFGPIRLGRLPAGKFRQLSASEVAALKRLVGLADADAG
ncbi:MAG: rRNA pseudouridine synthase [Armatimonadetes bacterium]|nr:rRNA pseudouridine synthase [Armatimonadota bacterium]